MTVEEHVRWAKQRAHSYVDAGEMNEAIASIISDLTKHEQTSSGALGCFVAALAIPEPRSKKDVRRFIDGCFPAV